MGQDPLLERAEEAPTPGHRSVRRELFQIATAVVVLAVVAGIPTFIFHNRGRSDLATFNSPATPVTSPSLPMTVTARGIPVTLQLVDSASSATSFHVSVKLPAYAVDQPTGFILGSTPANDAQVEGMNASASSLEALSMGNPAVTPTVWLEYPAPFPTNRTVTLTIDQLWLPEKPASPFATPTDWNTYTPTPVHMHAVSGPWTFHITPRMVATQALPTPQSGNDCLDGAVAITPPPKLICYTPMGAQLAERLVGFSIIEPRPLPAPLARDPFTVAVEGFGTSSLNSPNYAGLTYWTSQKSPQQNVQLIETTDLAAVPNINGNGETAAIVLPGSSGSPAYSLTIRPGSLVTTTIDGVKVTQFDVGASRFRTSYWVWTQGNVSSYIAYTARPPSPKRLLTDAELRQMVTSIIEQRAARATPEATP